MNNDKGRQRIPCDNCQPIEDEDGKVYYVCVRKCVPRRYKPKKENEK